ncbi:hypothetical protein [Melittangium boletus]|uniref:hypothetical protein n=1 Tax=Melittangium boletus TaxID=83453 RepID=UPI003DA60886
MKTLHSTARFWVAVLLGGLASGCAAAIACRAGESTVDCCIKKHSLTAMERCTASRADVLRVLRDLSLKIDDEDFENNKDLPEWKQLCIKNFVRCEEEGWSGSCYDCLRQCEGQYQWPSDWCPDPHEK